jgi:hypothetical protein
LAALRYRPADQSDNIGSGVVAAEPIGRMIAVCDAIRVRLQANPATK